VRLHAIVHGSRVSGPGLRSCVWFQGCQNMGEGGRGHCAGCWNAQLWDHKDGAEYDPAYLADQIFAHCVPGTEGLTISGGEPLQQAVSLKLLIREVKARRPDWSIGLFTGYTHRELAAGNYRPVVGSPGIRAFNQDLWRQIRAYLDFAIMGRFDRSKPTGPGALVSSENQAITLFSSRYTMSDFTPLSVEFSIDDTGLCQISGFPV
jgi:anaerobic ribonucleoside-triphosphate reductase activating protein